MTNTIQTITFHGQQLAVIPQQQKLYVAIKPICKNIGLNWDSQFRRIKRNAVLNEGIAIMATPSKGGNQETTCLPLELLNGWLFGVDTNRIKNEEIKERVIQYQRECYQVLFDYWTKGSASNPRKTTSEERNGLKNAVNMLVSKKGLFYPEAYALVHQQFNVRHIDELTRDQLPEAVDYIHNLALAGEYIQKQEAPALPEIARLDELKGQGQLIAITELELLHIHRLMGRMVLTNKIFNRYELYKVSRALGSRFGGEMLDQVGEGCCDAHKLKHLEPLMSSIYAKRVGTVAGSVFA